MWFKRTVTQNSVIWKGYFIHMYDKEHNSIKKNENHDITKWVSCWILPSCQPHGVTSWRHLAMHQKWRQTHWSVHHKDLESDLSSWHWAIVKGITDHWCLKKRDRSLFLSLFLPHTIWKSAQLCIFQLCLLQCLHSQTQFLCHCNLFLTDRPW